MNPIKQNHEAMLRTGAMALAAAGASTAAHAATVQITFNNSFVSTTSGIAALDTDIGGDNLPDVSGFASFWGAGVSGGDVGWNRVAVGGRMYSGGGLALLGYGASMVSVKGTPAVLAGLVRFRLLDSGVNGGAATDGWLDVTATGLGAGAVGRVDVHRFVFDDTGLGAPTDVAHSDAAYPEYGAAVVPEPSGLGLLALGAGGLLARRRRAMAA